ncbi:MAG: UDP-N-acetylglucosamine--N-acetylmuramyl-(pentapeptide) pyrophosphoryl-undecaprenol N-acetylglucosamine transferase [Actinobacteria bacterium]|nr:UDP-N-acetylglucosamine--N-acetylmuramyl-(pentapeptide) pyrophosphoryl-undecaprenol N-acetylglucosamine transferase [Actinomycetota bacterium]
MRDRPNADSATFVLVAGGGTAGHVLPGLAVAAALVDRGHSRSTIHFVGSERGLERTLVPESGFDLTLLPGRGIQRRFTYENLAAVWGLIRAVVKGIVLVRRRRPKVVLVLGGYASVSCTIGAVLWRVPIVVMEQNARAGAANRLAGRFAKASAVPFVETDLPRSVVTGNPVRAEVLAINRSTDREIARASLGVGERRTFIAVVTGSLGSRNVNEAVLARTDLAIRHVIGSRDWESVQGRLPQTDGLEYVAVRYEDRMDTVLAAADLLIGRAGGTTVAELAEVGVAGVLIPLPQAPRDHQTANAAALVRAGAAVLIPDSELDAERLISEVEPLIDALGRLGRMGAAAHTLAQPHAADSVAELVERHARRD